MSPVELESPSKLNVFLEVHGKRSDGFHELETVMLKTDFCDILRFERVNHSGIELQVSSDTPRELRAQFPLNESNLIVRAAERLRERLGIQAGARITVSKRIPPESGLAGGSGNAATTLRGLCLLWDLNCDESLLHEIAAGLGSDINFLLSGSAAALCRGRGELITPLELVGVHRFVAIRPRTGNSTPQVFRSLQLPSQPQSSTRIVDALEGRGHESIETLCFNRLTEPACRINPEMNSVLTHLREKLSRPAFMSGSGSTCFVFADDSNHAQAIHQQIQTQLALPSWVLTVGE